MRIRRAFRLAAAVVAGFAISPVGLMLWNTLGASPREIKDRNTEIVEAQAAVAALLTENTDLMLRLAHYVNRHPVKGGVMCPICSADDLHPIDWDTKPDIPQPPPICLPDTLAQLRADADEIHAAAESTLYSLMLQKNTLAHFLRTLRHRFHNASKN